MFKFEMGRIVKDSVTGFTGIITSRTEYLDGTNGYGVDAVVGNDNKPTEVKFFGESRLIVMNYE